MPPALKWFSPHKKGLISGIVLGGVAVASVFYSPLANYLLNHFGISKTFLIIGIGVGVIMVILAQFLNNPPQAIDLTPQDNSWRTATLSISPLRSKLETRIGGIC
jgi:predicted MFS family arabinose efflux permease